MKNIFASGEILIAASALASAATVRREDTASLTYADVLEQSHFESYVNALQAGQSGPGLYVQGGFAFGKIPKSEPYAVVPFANASALTLAAGAVPVIPHLADTRLCTVQGDPITCCDPAAAGDSCRAWFDFFKFCYTACVDDVKCQAVQVRMAAGECALFDGRVDGCLLAEQVTGTEEMDTDTFMMTWGYYGQGRDGGDAPVPEGYQVSPWYVINENLKPIKTQRLTDIPCDATYTSVRDQDVTECAGYCDKDTKCTAFGFYFDSVTGNATCALFNELTLADPERGWADGGQLYVKNETVLCGGKDESFLLEAWDSDATVHGCKPYLKAGDACRNSEGTCFDYEDLTNYNDGCAPDLACLQDSSSDYRTCRAIGTFTEEVGRQLQNFFAFAGKALPGTDAAAENSADMMYFDFSGQNWDYLYEIAYDCKSICENADVDRVCTAYELDKQTQQCIIAYGAVCASSFVTNENAVTIVTPNEKVYDQNGPLTELAGYKVIQNGYFPVVPANASDNVRVVDIPCDEFFTKDLVAMETDCLKQCDQWEGCHTVTLQTWENNCVLFKGDGIKWTNNYGQNFGRMTFVNPAQLKCAAEEFYGLLVVQEWAGNVETEPGVQTKWDAYKAELGYGAAGTLTPVYLTGNEEPGDCGRPIYTIGTAACIPYFKADALCSVEGDPREFFMDLVTTDFSGPDGTCGKGFSCESDDGDFEAEPEFAAPGYCKPAAADA